MVIDNTAVASQVERLGKVRYTSGRSSQCHRMIAHRSAEGGEVASAIGARYRTMHQAVNQVAAVRCCAMIVFEKVCILHSACVISWVSKNSKDGNP